MAAISGWSNTKSRGHERWVWASHRPGSRVAPWRSTTRASRVPAPWRSTAAMWSPSSRTSPSTGRASAGSPVQVTIRALASSVRSVGTGSASRGGPEPGTGRERDRHRERCPVEGRVERDGVGGARVDVEPEVGQPTHDLLQRHPQVEAGEVRPGAAVGPGAEAQVAVAGPVEVEGGRAAELAAVAVGGGP